MEEKSFVWTSELTKRLFELRFENDWLFKKLKQPWSHFFKILQENGFPDEMTIQHVRKKWSYTYDSYKIAKKTKNKDWKYYVMFDKHYGKTKVLDKYESWNDEWRLKLIMCMSEAKEMKIDFQNMWRAIERALRCQDLPIDCCIQDIKGLWHHIKMTFNRKHRLKTKNGTRSEWSLYDAMLEYFLAHDKEYLERLRGPRELAVKRKRRKDARGEEGQEFQWSKDITESFIQIRLQQDWLFRQRKWAWNELRNIMIEEFGFPKTLSSRELSRKWAATFAEFQKAQATNNRSWVYYQLFELYLGEGSLSLNPLLGWQESWVLSLIRARCECEALFEPAHRERASGWREVEKKLRTDGIPLDHSLLDLEEIWTHLLKTYRWKRKFANKGILNEHWPYFDAMSSYVDSRPEPPVKPRYSSDVPDEGAAGEECKPKPELSQCRSCAGDDACISVYQRDDQGVELALKLKTVGGVEVAAGDALPSHICLPCFNELEAAYKFRRRCQSADRALRGAGIKLEAPHDVTDHADTDYEPEEISKPIKMERKKKKARRLRYDYWKICEVCGKHTKNLMSHLDTHSDDKGYSCHVCEKRFKFKSGLIIHRAVHDPTPKKTCEVCGKTFHILAQYRRHFVYHANERKYGCETCGKRFNTMDILKVHNRSHTDERPFSCVDCGKTFRTAGCVSRHKRIVHRNLKQ